MKIELALVLTAILFSGSLATAYQCENRQAQVIAKVTAVETDNLTYCRAKVEFRLFQPHGLCPLTPEDAGIQKGLQFPLTNGHDCEISVGEEVSGVIISDGQNAYLE